jgi:hypothetical protein
MARKVVQYTETSEGRDKGKVFVITEMSAAQAERWSMKLLLALIRSGVNLPEDFANSGIAGIAQLGIKALAEIPWTDLDPMLEEMMSCIKYIPEPSRPQVVRPLFDGDIEEIRTSVMLRKEWLTMHLGFLMADAT